VKLPRFYTPALVRKAKRAAINGEKNRLGKTFGDWMGLNSADFAEYSVSDRKRYLVDWYTW
jgi:hypothetical protein